MVSSSLISEGKRIRSIPKLVLVTPPVVAVGQGVVDGCGGLSPDFLIVFVWVSTVLPLGVVVVTCDFVLLSSEQPEIPNPNPVNRTPISIALISFRMYCP
jgi:hypothetical protein